jgi:drug/metabolite transporter (DMT)-like permease
MLLTLPNQVGRREGADTMGFMSTSNGVLLALLSALFLSVLHLLAPRIRKLPLVPEHVTASFAGGIAVAYVFLHLLPELAEGNERVGELLDEQGPRSPLLGLEIFLVALVGFTVFYGLERLAERHRGTTDSLGHSGTRRQARWVPSSGCTSARSPCTTP